MEGTVQELQATPSRIQRFSFMSFGEEEKVAAPIVEIVEVPTQVIDPPAPETPQKLITEEEVKSARTEGHEQGHKEGFAAAEAKLNKATAKREEEIKSVLDLVAERISVAAAEHRTYLQEQQDMMHRLVLGIARKMAGDAMKSDPYAAVEATLRESLALIAGQPKITLNVPEGLSNGLKQRMDELRALLPEFEGELIVEIDPGMAENDCRVEWKNGYAERDAAKLWSEIETIITRIGKT